MPASPSAESLRAARTADTGRTFIIHVWREALAQGQTEWRGRVEDVRSGKVVYFRTWENLTSSILELLSQEPIVHEG